MPEISGLISRLSSRQLKYILFFCILLVAASIISVFVHHRVNRGLPFRPHPPEASEAALSIKGFRHTASQNGQKQWTLEADSAHLHVDPSEARLKNIQARFFPKDGRIVLLTADQGVLALASNNISASGNIVIEAPEYTIRTENLHYDHQLHIIKSSSPVNVTGPTFRLNAGEMTYNMQTGEITCTNHVEGFFFDIGETISD